MITYWRKWQLVRLISNECIETNAGIKAYSVEKTKRFIQNNTTYYGNLGTKEIDLILEKTPSDSVVNFEVILKRISGDKKIPRAEYQKILEDAESDGLVKIVKNETLPPNSDLTQIYVGITGKGLIFSRIDTLLHEVFFGKFNGLVALTISICMLIVTFLFSSQIDGLKKNIKNYVLKQIYLINKNY